MSSGELVRLRRGRLRLIGGLCVSSPGVARALVLLLLLLLLLRRGRVRLLYYVLPLGRGFERGADGRDELDQGVGHGRLDQLGGQLDNISTITPRGRLCRTYDIVLVIGGHLVDVVVDQGFEAIALAVDAELGRSGLQGQRREKDVLGEGQDTVVLSLLGSGLGLADLLADAVFRLEEVDLAVWTILVFAGAV